MGFISEWRALDLPRHRAALYRAWGAGWAAGVPLGRIADDLASGTPEPLRPLLDALTAATRRESIEEILARPVGGLPPFESAVLRMGAATGRLDECLSALADYCAAEQRAADRLRARLTAPLLQTVAALAIAPIPLAVSGRPLLYLAVVGGGFVTLLVGGGGALRAWVRRYRSQPDRVTARFCRSLGTALDVGLPLDRAAEGAVASAAHDGLRTHWRRVASAAANQPLSVTFAGAPPFPPAVTAALEVGEAAGNVIDPLRKLASLYEGDVTSHPR